MEVKFTFSIKGKYVCEDMEFDQNTPEYEIADIAFDLALKLAHTFFGRELSPSEIEDYLNNLDYEYAINS